MAFYCHKGLEGYSRDPGLDQNAVRDTGFDKNTVRDSEKRNIISGFGIGRYLGRGA